MSTHPMSAVGAVIHNDTLTLVIRRGDMLEEPLPLPATTPLAVAASLLAQRRDGAPIYLEAGGLAALALEEVKKRYSKSPDEIVNGMGPAQSMAEDGVLFANRRSELFFRFFEKVEHGKLVLPATFNEQLSAFKQQEQSGKIFFPPPDEVAGKLGKYPALALAAVLAAIEPQRFGTAKTKSNSGVGHDPYAKRLP